MVVIVDDMGEKIGYCKTHAHLLFGREVNFEVSDTDIEKIGCDFCGLGSHNTYVTNFNADSFDFVDCPHCGSRVPDASLLEFLPVQTDHFRKSLLLEKQLVPVVVAPDSVVVATTFKSGYMHYIAFRMNRDVYAVFLNESDFLQLMKKWHGDTPPL